MNNTTNMKDILNFVVASICLLTTYTHILIIGIIVLILLNVNNFVNNFKK